MSAPALEYDPYNPRILYELGTAHIRLQDWESAASELTRSLELEPQQPNAYHYLAEISLQGGDGVDYVRRLFQALEVDPQDHELPGLLAVFLFSTGCRRGEMLGLQWRDIDFDRRRITIRRSITAGRVSTPKSGRSRKRIDEILSRF